jgi:hypothetical protein
METFRARTYDRRELAQMYFPEATPDAAVRHLTQWIKNCPALTEALTRLGYKPRSRILPKIIVKTIVAYLDEP